MYCHVFKVKCWLLWDLVILWGAFVWWAVGRPDGGGKCDTVLTLGNTVQSPHPMFPTLTMTLCNGMLALELQSILKLITL